MSYIFLVFGFLILIKSADFLVDGASSFAKKFGISELVIGLTIVAFGTSAPELFVNVFSAMKGETGIALGNILGSNIANILLILGISGFIYPLKAKTSTVYKEIPFTLLSSFALFFLIFDSFFSQAKENILTRGDGLVLLLFFLIFFVYTFGISKQETQFFSEKVNEMSIVKSMIYIIGGIIGLALGAELLVRSARAIALSFGVSETFIGLTIVAVGTSLPELMTSIIASKKKNSDIAIGNIIGSNIFNTLFILGITSIIYPLSVESGSIFDVLFMILITFLLLIFLLFVGQREILGRLEGSIFLFLYMSYMSYLIYNQVLAI
ncbi:calcium/sodium antiporter [Candidatus Gracilibacteria bacterium]|nr:calcium/sodium antiporter [Candidatus Gracilibacteria bacterium]NUJ98380.1 calcium/sodium antiporter [Candidatus Gracilibacteria bacterium]